MHTQDLQQLAVAAAAHSTPLQAGDDGALRTFSHQDLRHVRRFSAGTPEPFGGYAGVAGQLQANAAGLHWNAAGGLAPLGRPSRVGGVQGPSPAGHDQSPAEVARRSSGLTPGQEVRTTRLSKLSINSLSA